MPKRQDELRDLRLAVSQVRQLCRDYLDRHSSDDFTGSWLAEDILAALDARWTDVEQG